VAIATAVSAVVAIVRHDFKVFLPVIVLAMWPALGGHYVELAFGSGIRGRISPDASYKQWFDCWYGLPAGVLLYLCMVATSRVLPIRPLPLRLWWCGAFCLS
jgi:hypothetical protein